MKSYSQPCGKVRTINPFTDGETEALRGKVADPECEYRSIGNSCLLLVCLCVFRNKTKNFKPSGNEICLICIFRFIVPKTKLRKHFKSLHGLPLCILSATQSSHRKNEVINSPSPFRVLLG